MADTKPAVPQNFWASKKRTEKITRYSVWVVLVLGSIVMLTPMVWMLSTSMKVRADVFAIPPIWIPHPLHWENYPTAWTVNHMFDSEGVTFTNYLINTLIIAVTNCIGVTLSSSLVAFAFARLRFPGRGILFIFCLATMMVPDQVTMIPTFILYKTIGWYDTFLPLIFPSFLGGGAYNIFLMRQFFMTIP